MKVLVTGSSGFIGDALVRTLAAEGHEPVCLVRSGPSTPGKVPWDPERGHVDPSLIEGAGAAVHLGAVSIGARRWNEAHKNQVLDSRMKGTRLLAKTLASLDQPPRVLVSASAVGVYGNRGDEVLTEESGLGKGFLAEVCKIWEAETRPAQEAGIRVVTTRSGLVLGPGGGILKRMLLPFRVGLGGRLGSGRQWWPWISLEDEVGAIIHAMNDEEMHGPVNVTAPQQVTNAEFTRVLGEVLGRPTALPAPTAALRIAFGPEMADELLLSGQRVVPKKLEGSIFTFKDPELEPALRRLLN